MGGWCQRRRHRVGGAVRPADLRVAHDGAHVQTALRRRRGRAGRPAVRRGRTRRTLVPQQHREVGGDGCGVRLGAESEDT